jgi:hypothetical protein
VCVLPYGFGGLWTAKAKALWAIQASEAGFVALGGRGVNNHLANRTLRLK